MRLRLLHGVRMDLPAPTASEIHDRAAVEKWRAFKFAWESYVLAKGNDEERENPSGNFADAYR